MGRGQRRGKEEGGEIDVSEWVWRYINEVRCIRVNTKRGYIHERGICVMTGNEEGRGMGGGGTLGRMEVEVSEWVWGYISGVQ